MSDTPAVEIEIGTDIRVRIPMTTPKELSRSIDILGMIAELRLPTTTAVFFTNMTAIEQQEWVDDLAARLVPPTAGCPFICLFDTGLNNAHPLLTRVIE